jgi:hypothetical protein
MVVAVSAVPAARSGRSLGVAAAGRRLPCGFAGWLRSPGKRNGSSRSFTPSSRLNGKDQPRAELLEIAEPHFEPYFNVMTDQYLLVLGFSAG